MSDEKVGNPKGTIVIGTIGGDCHVIGQWVLAKYFEQRDFRVIKLGICVTQEEFVNAAIETNADAVFVSSLYGMGFGDMVGLREKFVEGGKGDIVLYAGGILSVGAETVWKDTEDQWKATEAQYRAIGFDRAYSRDARLENVLKDLEADLSRVRLGRSSSAQAKG